MSDDVMPQVQSARVAKLEATASREPATSPRHLLAVAELAAARGDIFDAEAILFDVMGRHEADLRTDYRLLVSALIVAVAVRRLDAAAALVNRQAGSGEWFTFGVDYGSPSHLSVIRWDIEGVDRCRLVLNDKWVWSDLIEAVVERLASLVPLLAAYRFHAGLAAGSLVINLGDVGYVPGLAFCDNRPDFFLIPDAVFVQHRGYAAMRQAALASPVPWHDRIPIAYWRGGTSGQPRDRDIGWESLPRIELCRIAAQHGDLLDAGITHVAQMSTERDTQAVHASGLIRKFVPAIEFAKFRYQIDIDGNTNSWPGLFQKLLTGGPVLKIASPRNYRQWYYDRLRPWVNFVPVEGDMSDLVEKVLWLREHDDAARRIGENGQTLALSLDYETEVKAAGRIIAAAVRYFGGRPEIDVGFGREMHDEVRLLGGWSDTLPDGVSDDELGDGLAALGHTSGLELARPVAATSYVLSLDLSPCSGTASPPAQRVIVAANGEIVREVVVTERQVFHCRIAQATLRAAERLTVTLFHPDAASLASADRPLDDRLSSIVLHRLSLTPLSVHAKSAGEAMPVLPPNPFRRLHEQPSDELFGSDLWLPPAATMRQVRTHWGTVLFADTSRGALRHGPESSSPRNIMLAERDGTAILFHLAPGGERYTVRLPPVGQTAPDAASPGEDGLRCQTFRLVRTTPDAASPFGLRSKGLLVAAEPDGQVTLSRTGLGPWERFRLVEGA